MDGRYAPRFVIKYHMQSFFSQGQRDANWRHHPNGLRCNRETAFINSDEGIRLNITEKRYSLALQIHPTLGKYALVLVFDTFNNPDFATVPNDFGIRQWDGFELISAGPCTGIVDFQQQLCACIVSWQKDWNTTLDSLDEVISVKVGLSILGIRSTSAH